MTAGVRSTVSYTDVSKAVFDVCSSRRIFAVGQREVEIGGHRLGLAGADVEQLGEVAQDEDTRPVRYRTLGVTVVEI